MWVFYAPVSNFVLRCTHPETEEPKISTPIDVEVVNDPDPAANTAVPAEFAGFLSWKGSLAI
jgi:hypothetical protein